MQTETIIIGSGQAGLSVARYLKEQGRSFVILEKNTCIGASWSERYDSLVLDSFAKYSHLDGFPFPGDQRRQPTKDEVANYLQEFAKHFLLEPVLKTVVQKIEKADGVFFVTTNKGTYQAKSVVIATGPFQTAHIPTDVSKIPSTIFQIHSKEYKNPSQLKQGVTLVVGGGNSGAEIAQELAESGRNVCFSYAGTFKSVPSTSLSQWMAYVLGLAHIPKHTLLGRFVMWYTMRKSVGVDAKVLLSDPHISSVGRFLGCKDGAMVCTHKEIPDIKNIVWATGYQSDFSLIEIPAFDSKSVVRGVTNIPGLYLLNIRWQWSKSSSHLAGVSRDAKHIAKRIAL